MPSNNVLTLDLKKLVLEPAEFIWGNAVFDIHL